MVLGRFNATLKGIIKKHMDNHANNLDEKFYHFHHLHIEIDFLGIMFNNSDLYMGRKGSLF